MEAAVEDTENEPIFTDFIRQVSTAENVDQNRIADDEILNVFLPVLLKYLHQQHDNHRLDGAESRARFHDFESRCADDDFVSRLLTDRPDLVTHLHNDILRKQQFESWVNGCISADRPQLIEHSMIADTSAGTFDLLSVTGDWHNDNPTVRVTFRNDNLYLKNRTTNNSDLAHHIWNYLKSNDDRDVLLDLLWENSLTIGQHSWDKETKRSPLSEPNAANRYYRRLGQLLFLAYILELSDLHYENIIPNGEYPVIIDFETLGAVNMQKANQQLDQAYRDIIEAQQQSVILTGMLPAGSFNTKIDRVSPLYEAHFQNRNRIIVDYGKDTMHFERADGLRTGRTHLPYTVLGGNEQSISIKGHESSFIKGFTAAYEIFLTCKNEIIDFVAQHSQNCEARILLRNTRDYGAMLTMLASESGRGRADYYIEKFRDAGNGLEEGLLHSEKQSLLNGYIPAFYADFDSTILRNELGDAVGTLKAAPQETMLRHLTHINERRLPAQVELVDFSLSGITQMTEKRWSTLPLSKPSPAINHVKVGVAVTALSEQIQSAQHHAKDGSSNWESISVDDMDSLVLGPLNDGIYNGLDGVLLALGKHRASSWKPLMLKENRGSAYMGYLSTMLADPRTDPDELLLTLKEAVSADESYDVLSGTSGLILATRNLHGAQWQSFISDAADHLMANMQNESGTPVWPLGSLPRVNNASFAHGNAGIGTALMIAGQVTGNTSYTDLAIQTMQTDSTLKLPNGLWKDTRKQASEATANWCHGITGMAISRLLWLGYDDASGHTLLSSTLRDNLTSELHLSLSFLIDSIHDLESFSLCHGVTGSLQVLTYAAEHGMLGREELYRTNGAINEFVTFGLAQDWRCGTDNYSCYSLMTGLSGVLLYLKQLQSGQTTLEPLIPVCGLGD